MDMSEPLNRWRVNKLPFAGSQSDKSVNRIADFMVFFRHYGSQRCYYSATMMNAILSARYLAVDSDLSRELRYPYFGYGHLAPWS